MAVAKTRAIDPWKAKKWYPVYGPNYLRGFFIGETPASEREKVIGREISISLAAVGGELKKQHVRVTFKITSMNANNALTEVKKFEISPSHIKRQVRKGRDRVDDSFILKTSDKKEVALKPLLITKSRINNSKKTLLRKLAKQDLKEYVSKSQYNQLVQDLVTSRLQKMLAQSLRKVTPLKSAEIRVMQLLGEIAPEAAGEQAESQEPESEKEPVKVNSGEPAEEAAEESKPAVEKAKKAPRKKPAKKAESPE